MTFSLFVLLALLGIAHVTISTPVSSNQGIFVNLRIEGAARTIFEGPVFTRGHNVTTQSGGTHHCDGTNNHENPLPGPTTTSALDNAADLDHFTWDGTFDTQFDDYFVTRIADSAQTSTKFWGLLVNFEFTQVGGCQQEVGRTDHVLWAFDAFSKSHFLKLTGPKAARKNHPFTVTVIDGSSGQPISGASVDGHLTDANGKVILTFFGIGAQRLKAERSDSIRSNALEVLIIP